MKKIKLRMLVGTLGVLLVGSMLTGCGGNTEETKTVTLSGSSALLPLVEKSSESFKEKNSNITINSQAGGSGTGLTQVSDGTVNIGNSDVFAEEKLDEAKAKELVDHKVVAQGFAVVTTQDVKASSLTKDQIKDIFSGKVTNWKEVGGDDMPISVIHRPASSGTRGTFTKAILDGDKSLENDSIGATQDNNGAVLNAMKSSPGSISYVALSYMNGDDAKAKLKALSIDGVEATKANITEGKYPFWSWGHMYTKGEPSAEAKEFIDFIGSDENKKNVEDLGFISSADMKVK